MSEPHSTRRALVLAGGGYAASAWEIGMVTGMADAGVDVRDADLFVGTSAGARVALHLTSGVALEELFERQIGPTPRPTEPPPIIDWAKARRDMTRAKEAGGGQTAILRRIGSVALGVAPVDKLPSRQQTVAAQLPMRTWPEQDLLIPAVNAETGERRAFDRTSGIDLVDAVIATSAFLGWPPALFQNQHYIDGGFYSGDNADLAAAFDRVLILALRAPVPGVSVVSLEDAVETLRAGGSQVEIIHPDEDPQGSLMNPAVCKPAALAGRAQGRRLVERGIIASF